MSPNRKPGHLHCLQLHYHNLELPVPHKGTPAIPDRGDGIVDRIPCESCNKVYIEETA